MDYNALVAQTVASGRLPQALGKDLINFYSSYRTAIEANGKTILSLEPVFALFLDMVVAELDSPSTFETYHERTTAPWDYYKFGLDIMRPLINFEESTVESEEVLDAIESHLAHGENVILLANHQIEPDPQIIHLMLEKRHPRLAKEMIFIAGQRVITDPLAIPFSKGCNLLCIYSKKYIENPPAQKQEKQLHNQKVMKKMQSLLEEGKKCIYVAPSGGRDRLNEQGVLEVAPFDPQSIELFALIAKQSSKRTHFYPLALYTYPLMPPPERVRTDLGENRYSESAPVHLWFGSEIDMLNFPGACPEDRRQNRILRAEYIQNVVRKAYSRFKTS